MQKIGIKKTESEERKEERRHVCEKEACVKGKVKTLYSIIECLS